MHNHHQNSCTCPSCHEGQPTPATIMRADTHEAAHPTSGDDPPDEDEPHTHTDHACGCGSSCGHQHGAMQPPHTLWLMAGGAAALGVSLLPFGTTFPFWKPIFSLIAVLLPGWSLFVLGIKAALRRQLDELFLLTVAVVAAFLLGEYGEAALVTLLFRLGQLLEDRAVAKSRREISALTAIRPDTANLQAADGSFSAIDALHIPLGSIIQIRPGERVPLDCVVEQGISAVDCAAVTGESLPTEVHPGDHLPASGVNGGGLLVCRTTSGFSDSTASRIIALVEQSAAKKGETEAFITRFARVYTPIVLVLAGLLAFLPPLLGFGSYGTWISRALVFLVASCPCALVISVPLAFFAGIGAASKRGVIIKGSKFIERLARLSCAVFDKTGTLTSGRLSLGRVEAVGSWSVKDVLHTASAAEQDSLHPIARAIAAYHDTLPPHTAHARTAFVETSGHGVSTVLDGRTILCGSKRFLAQNNIDTAPLDGFSVYLAVDGVFAGGIELVDRAREDAAETLRRLREAGVQRTVMLTGDNPISAAQIAKAVGIDEFYASLLPQDKVDQLELCKKKYGVTLFTGDGINDAPVLAGADIGCAMGLGSDAAIEAADLVLLSDRLSALPEAVAISQRTMSIARFNIAFALAVKVVVLSLGAMGLAQMWMAVFADVGVSILAVLNSVRLLSSSSK